MFRLKWWISERTEDVLRAIIIIAGVGLVVLALQLIFNGGLTGP